MGEVDGEKLRFKMHEKKMKTLVKYSAVTIFSVLVISLIGAFTNELTLRITDSACYINMAEHGIAGNNALVSPFAYRFVTTELARYMTMFFDMDLHDAFTAIFWSGAILQLLFVYIFAKKMGGSETDAVFIMLVIAFNFCHVKQLQYNIYRVDHLAYFLLLLELLLYLEKRYLSVLFIGIPGMFIKEFLVVPVLLVSYDILMDKNDAWVKKVFRAGVPVLLIVGFYIISRIEIPVQSSCQYIDPIKRGDGLLALANPFLNPKVLLNVFLVIIAYFLPAIAISVFYGFRSIRECLKIHRWLLPYFLMVLVLTLYGGTDHARFATFFAPVLIVFLASQFKQPTVWEKIFLLILLVWFNKILLYIPQTPDALTALQRRHWYGFWSDELTIYDFYRVLQMLAVVSCFWLVARVGHFKLRRTTI